MTISEYSLSLSGVRCMKCVAKITSTLKEQDPDSVFSINETKDQATISSTLPSEQVIQLIEEAGYGASHLDETSVAAEKVAAETHPEEKEPEEKEPVKTSSVQLALSGVTCASCVSAIEGALEKQSGVTSFQVNFANRTVSVEASVPASELIQAIQSIGYDATEIEDEDKAEDEKATREAQEYRLKIRQSVIGLGVGIPLMLYGLLGGPMQVNQLSERVLWFGIGMLVLLILWQAGKHFFTGAWTALLNRHATMNTLIALGTGSAWLYSMVVILGGEWLPDNAKHLYFEAAVMIIGLINFGQALELKARGKTSQAIKRLLDLRVKSAVVIRNGKEEVLPVDQVVVGDKVRLRAGEKVPVDGVIIEGESTFDESMLTGEPVPVTKASGSVISAGTINGQGSVVFEVQKVGKDTVLAQIIGMVAHAQNSKPPISHMADRVSAIFVPMVMIVSVLTALAWYNFAPQLPSVYMLVTAVSVLIIACPCALGLAAPISTMIAIGKAAEAGGLIRNGEALQRASELDLVVLDKTGTITQGTPQVTYFHTFRHDDGLLSQVEALEKGANHPLAQAIMDFSQKEKAKERHQSGEAPYLTDFESLTGLGVTALCDGKRLLLGNERLMNHYQVEIKQASDQVSQCDAAGNTPVYFAVDKEVKALFGISDPIREEAKQAIQRLQQQKIRVVMLTGDNQNTAQRVAAEVGVDEFHGDLMPEEKLNWIRQYQSQGNVVSMVGDGINDAPALAQSDVGFAMGGGTDVAIESADITLMRHSLHGVSDVIAISGAAIKNIKQNLWGAFVYNALGIPIAAGLLYPLTGEILSPIIAGIAMSLSSFTVVTNANRLRLYVPSFLSKER